MKPNWILLSLLLLLEEMLFLLVSFLCNPGANRKDSRLVSSQKKKKVSPKTTAMVSSKQETIAVVFGETNPESLLQH